MQTLRVPWKDVALSFATCECRGEDVIASNACVESADELSVSGRTPPLQGPVRSETAPDAAVAQRTRPAMPRLSRPKRAPKQAAPAEEAEETTTERKPFKFSLPSFAAISAGDNNPLKDFRPPSWLELPFGLSIIRDDGNQEHPNKRKLTTVQEFFRYTDAQGADSICCRSQLPELQTSKARFMRTAVLSTRVHSVILRPNHASLRDSLCTMKTHLCSPSRPGLASCTLIPTSLSCERSVVRFGALGPPKTGTECA